MERFTHPDCAAMQHGCRFNAAPKWSKILLLLFISTFFTGFLSAQCSYTFSLETASGTPLLGTDAGNYSAPSFADVDGDGLEDLVVGNADGQIKTYIRVLPINNPVFVEVIGAGSNPFDGIDVGSRARPAFVDIDGDGDEDLFVGEQDGTFNYFRNDAGVFVAVIGAGNPLDGFDIGSYSAPAFGDIDGDGDFDLVAGRNGSIRIYENTGTHMAPNFGILFTNLATTGGNIFSPALSDIDNDGDLDVVSGNSNGNLTYYRNNGASFSSVALSGVSTPALNGASATNNNNSMPAFTDMDGDEDMDIAVGIRNGRFRFLRNISCADEPTITCSPDITVDLDNFGAYELTLSNLGASGAATCGIPTPIYTISIDGDPNTAVTGGPLLLDCMDFPGVTVVVEAQDACNGRSALCYVDVTIEDNIAPEAKCIDTLEISLDDNGQADIFAFDSEVYINGGDIILTPWDINDGSLDNCDESFLSFEFDPFSLSAAFDCSDIGVSPVSITMVVIDDVGNEGRCETALVIADNTEPNIPAIASRTIDLCQIQSGSIGNFVANAFHGIANVTTLDNCGAVTVTSIPADPSSWTTPGTYSIQWQFNDGHGNIATRTQSVQVVNNAGPVLNCPANVVVNTTNTNGTPCGDVATFAAATFDPTICNNDAITSSLTSSHTSGSRFPEGTTIVTYLAYDNAGNSGFCTFTVTVSEPPVISGMPGNINMNAATGQCGAIVNWTVPMASDDCSMPSLAGSRQPNTFFNIGSTIVTYTATDAKGNTATASFTVTVVDNQPPSLTCPPPIQVNNQPGNCFANVFTIVPTPTDNCPDNLNLTTTRVPAAAPFLPNRFPVGVTTITHTATDGSNPSVSCSYTVTVRDNELPVWSNCPQNVILPASGTSSSCTQAYSWASPTVTDNCTGTISNYTVTITGAGATVSTTTPSGSSISHNGTFREGVTTITYTATDNATPTSNTAVCSFTIEVRNTTAPTITCGSSSSANPVLVNASANQCYLLFNGSFAPIGGYGSLPTTAAESPDCDPGKLAFMFNSNNTPLVAGTTQLPVGEHILRARAVDVSGNTSTNSCLITLRVRETVAPSTANCPANRVENASSAANTCGVTLTNLASPTWTDNCANAAYLSANASVTRTGPNGPIVNNFFPVGVSTVVHTTRDGAAPWGNIGICTYIITVNDASKPTLSCPANIAVNNTPTSCDAVVNFNEPTATDNCTLQTVLQTFNYTGLIEAWTVPPGVTSITIEARGAEGGNNPSSSFGPGMGAILQGDFAVTPGDQLKILVGQKPQTNNNGGGGGSFVATMANLPLIVAGGGGGSANGDNPNKHAQLSTSGGNSLVGSLGSSLGGILGNGGGDFVGGGGYRGGGGGGFFTDGAMGSSTNDFGRAFVNGGNGGNSGFIGGSIGGFGGGAQGSGSTAGGAGGGYSGGGGGGYNIITNTFSIAGGGGGSFNGGTNTTASVGNTGNGVVIITAASMPSQTAGLPSGSSFPLGVTTNTFTLTDASGNTGTCSFTVTVNDNQGPVFANCPGNRVQNIANCTLPANSVSWATPVANDNCDGPVLNSVLTTTPGITTEPFLIGLRRINQALSPGDYTIQYTATDAAGNTGVCSFIVSVREVTPPTFSNMPSPGVCPPATVAAGPNCAVVITAGMLATPAATDNCPGNVNVTRLGNLPGTATAVNNSITVNWRATDVSGNSSDCSQTITVRDQTPPTLNCHSSANSPIVVNASPNQPCLGISPNELFASNQWIAPTASDNCAGALTPVFIGNQPSYYPIGVSQLTYRASDNASPSNSATCIVYLRVVESDLVPPSIICPSNVTVNANPATCFATNVNLGNPNTSDTGGCSSNVSVSNNAPAQYNLGTTAVTWTVTDGGGNSAVCVQTVLVNANQEVCDNGVDDDCNPNTPDDCGGNGGGGGGNGDLCQIKLLSDDGIARDSFGFSGVLEGNIAVIGAPRDESGSGFNSGAVYVYDIDAGGAGAWGQINKLTASDGAAQDLFGFSLDFDGSFLVVGAPANAGKGAAYVFNSAWSQVAKLTAPDGLSGDQFGHSVSLDGNFLVIGAPLHDLSSPVRVDAGAAYLYQYNGSSWVFLKKLTASDAVAADRFGFAVDLDGQHVVAGAPLADPLGVSSAGAAYVFRQDMGGANNWGQQKKLNVGAPDAQSGDEFGASVSVSGTRLAVGAYKDSHSALTRPGSVFVYEQAQGGANNWGLLKKIVAVDPLANDQFGFSVCLNGEDLLIGSRFDDDQTSNSGSAYWMRQNEGGANNYGLFEKILGAGGTANDNFGQFVSISDGIYLVGSVRDDIGNNLDQGSAYILGDCAFAQRSFDADESTFLESTELRCFPNPVRDLLNIEVQLSEQEEDLHIVITDAAGRMVAEVFHGTAAGYNRFRWASSQFEAGAYFVRVESASVQQVVPLVLMK